MTLSLSHSLALGRLPIIMGPCEVRRHRQATYPLQTRLASRHCSVQQVSSTGGVNVFESNVFTPVIICERNAASKSE